MGEDRVVGYGLIALGTGITAWGAFSYFQKKALIEDYINETKIYREALIRAYEDGEVTDEEREFLEYMQSELTRKEKLIEDAGFGQDLVEALRWAFGIMIAYAAYKITSRLLERLWRKYRPPGKTWKCPICDKEFPTEDDLNRHIDEDHDTSTDPALYVALWEALQETPEWFKYAVAEVSGLAIGTIEKGKEWFENLPDSEKIALGILIAVAVIALCVLAWWAVGGAAIAKTLGAACAVFI